MNNIFPVALSSGWLNSCMRLSLRGRSTTGKISVLLRKDILKLENKGNARKITMIRSEMMRQIGGLNRIIRFGYVQHC